MSRRRDKSRIRTWDRAKSKYKAWKDPRVGDMALWVMTPFGVLMPSKRPVKLLAEGDDRTLQVRARRSEYLDRFRETFCPELGDNEHHPSQDYQWKAPVSPDALARAMARMVLEIDSEKFKPLAEDSKYALKDKKLARALHGMYSRLWSDQLSYGDGTSSYDYKPYVSKGIDECVRLGHWWPSNREFCTDCGKPRPSGFPVDKPGPSGVRPGKDEVAEWKAAEAERRAKDAAEWKKSWSITGSATPTGTGWASGSATAESYPFACDKWGHYWPAGLAGCKYCDEPRPDGIDDDQDVTLSVSGTLYVDGSPIGQYDPDLGFTAGPGDPDDDPDGTSCPRYGHLWQEYFEECQYCGEPRPGGFPFDVELTSDRDGNYYIEGMLTQPDGTPHEDETSPGEQAPEEMAPAAPAGAENEEKAHA